MPTPEDYALAAASSANDALLSALLATAKSVLTSEDEVAAAQWAADAYTYMLNCQNGVSIVNNNTTIEAAILALATDFATKYLGSFASAPVTTQVGAQYWNSTNNLMYTWSGTSWDTIPVFDGNINAGTSSVPVGKIQLRRDLAGSWTVANPILGLGELGIESDTGYIKIGDGTSNWTDLAYSGSPKSSVGLGNVSNLAPIDLPVSTAQALADQAILTEAKAYTDTSDLNHFIDVGEYSVSITNAYPIDGGTGTLGLILRGNVFNVIGSGTINSTIISEGYSLRALVDDPSQSDIDWLITTNPITNDNPYIVVLNIPGAVMSDFVFPSHIFTLPVSFAIDFALSKAHSRIYATNNFVFTIRKNGINIGTLTFETGTSIGVFVAISTSSFIAGDIIEIKSQLISDPSLSDVTISLLGSRI